MRNIEISCKCRAYLNGIILAIVNEQITFCCYSIKITDNNDVFTWTPVTYVHRNI